LSIARFDFSSFQLMSAKG